MRGEPGGAARGGAALGPLLALAWACAGPLVAVDGGFRHAQLGYSFRPPAPAWRLVKLEGTDVAYRDAGRATMSLQTTCGEPVAAPAILARHLRIGLAEHELLHAGPVAVDGRAAWEQRIGLETRAGERVQIKTVTAVARGCSYDWLLAAPGISERVERDFDAWWQGFRLPAEDGGGSA